MNYESLPYPFDRVVAIIARFFELLFAGNMLALTLFLLLFLTIFFVVYWLLADSEYATADGSYSRRDFTSTDDAKKDITTKTITTKTFTDTKSTAKSGLGLGAAGFALNLDDDIKKEKKVESTPPPAPKVETPAPKKASASSQRILPRESISTLEVTDEALESNAFTDELTMGTMREDPTWGMIYISEPDQKDDLKQIWGVAHVLEGVLNDHGVYRFKQIAAWKKPVINAFSKFIHFKKRVYQERWVAQAKILHEMKYKERL